MKKVLEILFSFPDWFWKLHYSVLFLILKFWWCYILLVQLERIFPWSKWPWKNDHLLAFIVQKSDRLWSCLQQIQGNTLLERECAVTTQDLWFLYEFYLVHSKFCTTCVRTCKLANIVVSIIRYGYVSYHVQKVPYCNDVLEVLRNSAM